MSPIKHLEIMKFPFFFKFSKRYSSYDIGCKKMFSCINMISFEFWLIPGGKYQTAVTYFLIKKDKFVTSRLQK